MESKSPSNPTQRLPGLFGIDLIIPLAGLAVRFAWLLRNLYFSHATPQLFRTLNYSADLGLNFQHTQPPKF